jgi:hypothetical protein
MKDQEARCKVRNCATEAFAHWANGAESIPVETGPSVRGRILFHVSHKVKAEITHSREYKAMDLWIGKLGREYLLSPAAINGLATLFEKPDGVNRNKLGTVSKLFPDHREEYLISTSEFNGENIRRLVEILRSWKDQVRETRRRDRLRIPSPPSRISNQRSSESRPAEAGTAGSTFTRKPVITQAR